MLTLREIKALVALGLFILLFVLFRLYLHDRDKRQNTEAALSQSQATNAAASQIAGVSTKAADEQVTHTTEVVTHRVVIEQQQETLRRENSNVNAWSNGAIPVELRDADRKARLDASGPSDLQGGAKADTKAAQD